MPTYLFKNTKTDEVTKEFMSISAREKYLEENPHIQPVPASPALHSGIGLGVRKPDAAFTDLLQSKKDFYRGNTIKTGNITQI